MREKDRVVFLPRCILEHWGACVLFDMIETVFFPSGTSTVYVYPRHSVQCKEVKCVFPRELGTVFKKFKKKI